MRMNLFLLFSFSFLSAFGGDEFTLVDKREKISKYSKVLDHFFKDQSNYIDYVSLAKSVNKFVNHRVEFETDIVLFQIKDYWQSLLEVITRGKGDCEDYAIAKIELLVLLGVPSSLLQLARVSTKLGAHIVVYFYLNGVDQEPIVLDNLTDELRYASEKESLSIFTFGSRGIYINPLTAKRRNVGPANKLDIYRNFKVSELKLLKLLDDLSYGLENSIQSDEVINSFYKTHQSYLAEVSEGYLSP